MVNRSASDDKNIFFSSSESLIFLPQLLKFISHKQSRRIKFNKANRPISTLSMDAGGKRRLEWTSRAKLTASNAPCIAVTLIESD